MIRVVVCKDERGVYNVVSDTEGVEVVIVNGERDIDEDEIPMPNLFYSDIHRAGTAERNEDFTNEAFKLSRSN